jgi:polar amino acid transport system substrate-binding protein
MAKRSIFFLVGVIVFTFAIGCQKTETETKKAVDEPVKTEKTDSILDDVKKRGVVRIGSGTTSPPVNYIDKDGNWTGFDIDLGDAIAERLGVKVDRVNVNNKTRIVFLANRRIDLTISSMSHTRSRDEQVDYAEPPYLWSGKIFYAKEGRFSKPMDLCGMRLAVVQGSNAYIAGQEYLKELGCDKKFHIVSFQTNSECFMGLKQGKVDAYVQDTPIIAGVAGAEGVDYEPVGPIFSPGLYGIGVPANDSKWRDTISFVLQDLIKDGTYEKIYQKWFGPNGISPLPINARPRLPEDIFGDRNQFVWPN